MQSTNFSVLYLGAENGTSLDRANALRRLGHSVEHIDLRKMLPNSPWIDRIIWNLGGQYLTFFLIKKLINFLENKSYDICWVDGGELVSSKIMYLLKSKANKVVNYNIDDPLGDRDRARFSAYKNSLFLYDLVVVVRNENISEAYKLDAKKVLRVYRSADEVTHKSQTLSKDEYNQLKSDVLFAGTWFPERCDFMLKLIALGVPLTIRGDRWDKSPNWQKIKPYWKPSLQNDQYVKLIQSAKICLGLLSKGNRDLHTTRSAEIPAIGSLLCAERTLEHQTMYVEGKEALFWKDADECASVCLEALNNPNLIKEISYAGHQRLMRDKYLNENVISNILSYLYPKKP